MKSYAIVEWGAPLEERDSATPVPHGGEVLVRVERCGVCHSDVHIRHGGFDMGHGHTARLDARLPLTMGHEIVGTVAALGPEAAGVALGQRVVVYPWMGCGNCPACADGRDIDCLQHQSLGVRRDGGYADHVLVSHGRYLLEYGTIDPNVAATCACSALTAYSALKKLPRLAATDTVLVIGAGGLGLAATSLASAVTPARVAVADIDGAKLTAARDAGAALTFVSARDDAAKALRGALGGPVRGVIDFVGSPGTVRLALDVADKGATIVIVGLFGGSIDLSTALLPLRNIALRGSYTGSLDEMKELLAIVAARGAYAVPIATRPMREVNATLDDLQSGRVIGRVVATV